MQARQGHRHHDRRMASAETPSDLPAGALPDTSDEALIGESRWPPAFALVSFLILNVAVRLWLPGQGAIRLPWLLPGVEAVLLLALIAGPARIGARTQTLRRVCLTLVGVLVAAALLSTVILVGDLIEGTGVTNQPSELLASGALVWVGNNIAFALLYWLIDGGGPVARMRDVDPRRLRVHAAAQPRGRAPAGGRCSSTTCTWASPTRRPSARPT